MVYFFLTGIRNIDLQVRIDTTNLSNAFVECTFYQPGYTCTIDYDTDPSYTNLHYGDTSSTLGRTATITLSQMLSEDTIYYYIVSAESSSQCVRMRGRFRTGTKVEVIWYKNSCSMYSSYVQTSQQELRIKTSALFCNPKLSFFFFCGGNASVLLRPR